PHRAPVPVPLYILVDLEALLPEPLDRLEVTLVIEAFGSADAIAPDRQRARTGDLRIQLAGRAGSRVARVGKGRQALCHTLLVQPGEVGERQVDLAAHLDQKRGGRASFGV